MSVYKAVIIGCGKIAGGYDVPRVPHLVRTHARAYSTCGETKLAAVMDADMGRARLFASEWKVPRYYSSVHEMLREEVPDIVSICSPDGRHADDLRTCLEFPGIRAIWCEKPLALDVCEAETVVGHAEERGTILAVNYQRQWEPAHVVLADEIRSGHWGRVTGVCSSYSKGILHNGSHMISLLRSFLGEPTEMRVHRAFYEYSDADPTVDASLSFSGVPVRLIGLPVPPYDVFESVLYTERGTIQLIDSGYKILRRRFDPLKKKLSTANSTATLLGRALSFVLDDICNALRTEGRVRVNGTEALQTLRICSELAQMGGKP